MLIRSQDKLILVDAKEIHSDITAYGTYKIYANDYTLGIYSTKENAIKVIDMIQACLSKDFSKINFNPIKGASILKDMLEGICTFTDCVSIIKDNFIFQMPQYSEVE